MSLEAVKSFLLTLGSCLIGQSRRLVVKGTNDEPLFIPETISFHVGVVLACAILMRTLKATQRQQFTSGVPKDFRSVI
jgi:hypothetical protein